MFNAPNFANVGNIFGSGYERPSQVFPLFGLARHVAANTGTVKGREAILNCCGQKLLYADFDNKIYQNIY